jgi:tetraacyldisaccharide 4'-kinase
MKEGNQSQRLSLLEAIYYHFYQRRRARWHDVSPEPVAAKIVSIGNLTTGGTGKTPAVQWLVRELQARDWRPVVVSRGYGGTLSAQGAIVSDGNKVLCDVKMAGDEPLLHAQNLAGVPVVIGRDRNQAVHLAIEKFQPDVVVLDDAFQYWSLPRHADVVLLDARHPFGNGRLLPVGRLREPAQALERATAIVLTRSDAASEAEKQAARQQIRQYSKAPIWEATHQPLAVRDVHTQQEHALAVLNDASVAALAALAHNAEFFRSLETRGAHLVARLARRDHHAWREAEVRQFASHARQAGAQAIVTTEKDVVKLSPAWTRHLPLWVLKIVWQVNDGDGLVDNVLNQLSAPPNAATKVL